MIFIAPGRLHSPTNEYHYRLGVDIELGKVPDQNLGSDS